MCGICGQYNFKDQTPVKDENIEKMTRTLAHRGPDDEGLYVSSSLGFGFKRLSIIDLQGGHQPMSDNEKSVWIVFNIPPDGTPPATPSIRDRLRSMGRVSA